MWYYTFVQGIKFNGDDNLINIGIRIFYNLFEHEFIEKFIPCNKFNIY